MLPGACTELLFDCYLNKMHPSHVVNININIDAKLPLNNANKQTTNTDTNTHQALVESVSPSVRHMVMTVK